MPKKKKTEEKKTAEMVHQPEVVRQSLEDILADRFNRYSKSVIQERALPDARDGLKPVQRRILWSMWEDGNTYNHPYRKSAKTVGNVIGNYHPHGDISVYDAIVRMSQDWKTRIPLIDMQGNNGSIDNDPAAAMRYTEARLSKLANFLMEDIDKQTVDWAPNFSDDKMEPIVLPSRYPNLLVSGISGIASGYATNIPPHNLGEVLDATIDRIRNPDSSLEELMKFVKGPDFPTGGLVMGMDGVRDGLRTGQGKFFIRAVHEVVETKTINQIVIHEIPYGVVKSDLVKKIDEIRLDHKIDGLMDVRDESDRTGLRIVLDLKKETGIDAVLNYLYKNTPMQVTFTYNTTAIVHKSPVVMGLAQILDVFIEYREEVVIKRTQYDLNGKMKRAHIVEGLVKAVSILDEVIALIRASKNKADSKTRLMDTYGFSEAQAEAIVTLQLYRLSNTDVVELQQEAERLEKEIADLKEILEKPERRHALMIEELQAMKEEFDAPRKTKLQEQTEEIVIDEKAMIAREQVMITVSRDGYVKKVSLRSYNSSKDTPSGIKEGDVYMGAAEVSTLDTLLLFTDRGRYGEIPVYMLEEGRWKDMGKHISSYMKTDGQEKVIAAYTFAKKPENLHFVMASANGQIKQISFDQFPAFRSKTTAVMNIPADDSMVSAFPAYSETDIVVLASQTGYGLSYPVAQIPEHSPKTRGVKGMNLNDGDHVIKALLRDADTALISLSNNGIKRVDAADIPLINRPGKGVRLYKAVKSKPVDVRDIIVTPAGQELTVLKDGQLEPFKPTDISKMDLSQKYSMPFGDEPVTFLPPLPALSDGYFQKESDNQLELPLFEVENAG